MELKIILVLIVLLAIFIFLYFNLRKKFRELAYRKRSQSSKYGKMTEQFLPFLGEYPYNPQNFRFLGTPIDGVQFEDDKIIFIEFKAAGSQLNQKQRNISKIISDGKVTFEEHRIE